MALLTSDSNSILPHLATQRKFEFVSFKNRSKNGIEIKNTKFIGNVDYIVPVLSYKINKKP